MARAKTGRDKPPPGPDELVRASAGAYRSGDSRFEIQKSDRGWYVVDGEQSDELGQQLIHGPFATLDAVRGSLAGLRELKPLPRVRQARRRPAPPVQPPPPPPSWIDLLPRVEAKSVRELIGALEREGVDDAEELVRRQRDRRGPLIATRLLEQRLEALLTDANKSQAELLNEAIAVIAGRGSTRALPGWALVEVPAGSQPEGETIKPRLR